MLASPTFCCIINGPCSTGKSTLAQALQNKLPDPNIHLGIDAFHLAIPPRALNLSAPDPDYLQPKVLEEDGKRLTFIEHGQYIHRINEARFEAVHAFVKRGITVICDELLWTADDVKTLVQGLAGLKVYLIGVHIDPNAGDAREQKRFEGQSADVAQGFRPEGMSRASASCVHQHMRYDLEFDNSDLTPEQAAEKVLAFIDANKAPKAIEDLGQALSEG